MKTRTIVTAVLVFGLLGATAHAQPVTPVQRPLMDTSLKTLPFDGSVAKTMAWVRTRLVRHAYQGLDKATARARAAQESARLAKRMVSFNGLKATGYETSVVDEEFKTGNDETLIAFNDGAAQHYLFFFRGKLYKYVRPMPVGEVSFVDRVQVLAVTLGEPTGTYSPDGTAAAVASANWLRKAVATRIVDRRATYKNDLLVIEDTKLVAAVEASRAGIRRAEQRGKVSSELDAFLEDAPVE